MVFEVISSTNMSYKLYWQKPRWKRVLKCESEDVSPGRRNSALGRKEIILFICIHVLFILSSVVMFLMWL